MRWLLALVGPLVLAASSNSSLVTLGPDLARAKATFRGAGERLWKGYGSAPAGMLLITANKETLICQAKPPADFSTQGRDPSTGCATFVRPRSNLPEGLLAAMPIFGPASTIVMGTPEATGFARNDWLRTILHEHFHQWQTSRPGYFKRVNALGLAGGDTTGMWMLNFPFPYADPLVGAAYARASIALADALAARGSTGFIPAFDRYLRARDAFAMASGAQNWRYLEFQLWQEGGARWTEYALAKSDVLVEAREPAFAGEQRTVARLRNPDLKAQGRDLAYTYGTAELILVDACGPSWRHAYPFATSLGEILQQSRKDCGSQRHASRSRE